MSLLRDALKRAEELKRTQQQVPTPPELLQHARRSNDSATAAAPTATPAEHSKIELELAPLSAPAPAPTSTLSTDSHHAIDAALGNPASPFSPLDRTTPSRPTGPTGAAAPRDRSVPGTLRPATEAIMRRDAQNLSLARAAQELEDLNNADFERSISSAPLQRASPAMVPAGAPTAMATPTAAPQVAENIKTEKPKTVKLQSEVAADAEKFADRDAVKRMMAQRIAAEAEAIQNRRTRTLAIGAGAVFALVALGGWYVWKETNRFDKPMEGATLRLGTNANAGKVAPAVVPTTAPPVVPITAPAAALSNSPSVTTGALAPINPNIGQLPRPSASPALPPATVTAPAATAVTSIATPPILNTPAAVAMVAVPSSVRPPALLRQTPALAMRPVTSTATANTTTADDSQVDPSAGRPNKNNSAAANKSPRLVTIINRGATPPSAVLLAGYSALLAGNATSAFASYAEAAQATPDNIDAHLGLAVSAAKLNDLNLARRAFARVLELDPRNSHASAGLLLLSAGANLSNTAANDGAANEPPSNMASFIRQERELKKLLQAAPQSASLNFSLGNLYATEKRWTDAQQAFFEAFAVEPNNADFAYNLAVSLDQLGQKKLALRYYETAAKLKTNGRGGQFSSPQIAERIADLTTEMVPVVVPIAATKSEAK